MVKLPSIFASITGDGAGFHQGAINRKDRSSQRDRLSPGRYSTSSLISVCFACEAVGIGQFLEIAVDDNLQELLTKSTQG
jgi:hypothetical protein